MILTAAHLLLVSAALFCAVTGLYLLVVTIAAYGLKPNHRAPVEYPPCAVVIPAHNEALQIGRTLEHLARSNYPEDLFQAYVIADNCDDDTAGTARAAGATVFERTDPDNRGKGQALDWCFRNHTEMLRTHPVTVVIDADSMVEPDFLAALAARLLEPGVAAVQGNNSVANPLQHWRTALTAASFALVNCVRPAGLARLGTSAGLKGNGMGFQSGLLAHRGWPAHSIVEDVEFGVRLLLEGHRTVFDLDARISSDMPAGRRQADAQRRRWEFGRLQVARRYIPALVRAMMTDRASRYIGALMELLVPPLSVLALFEVAGLLLSFFVHPVWTAVFAACIAMTALHVALGLRYCRMPGGVWLALAAAPAFLLWKLGVYAGLVLTRGQRGWVRTPRDGEPSAGGFPHPPEKDRQS
jgi:cellulose synthase/poly-beta-1,6-N-acetylglucosamine synthase-like glycosyltransferase